MRKLLCSLLFMIVLATPTLAQYAIGDTVENFTLRDSNGEFVSLSDYPNRIVFLVFWSIG